MIESYNCICDSKLYFNYNKTLFYQSIYKINKINGFYCNRCCSSIAINYDFDYYKLYFYEFCSHIKNKKIKLCGRNYDNNTTELFEIKYSDKYIDYDLQSILKIPYVDLNILNLKNEYNHLIKKLKKLLILT